MTGILPDTRTDKIKELCAKLQFRDTFKGEEYAMADHIRIGVIGAGRIGRIHARNLAFLIPDAQVVGVADPFVDAAQACARECGVSHVAQDYHEILENKAVEAVFICSSTDTHAQIMMEAAQAGKHIFCEKPIDLDPQRIDEALDAVAQAGVTLQVGFNRRFDPSFSQAKATVKQGKIGTPHLVRITSRDPEPPPLDYVKVSGGLFLDMAIHDFDMCRFLMDAEVTEIYATGASLVNPEIGRVGDIDTAVTTLTYTTGAFCTIDNSRKAVYGYDQRIEIFGSEGCVIVGNREPYSGTLYTAENVQRNLPYHFFLDRYQEAYLEETRQFVQCLLRGAPSPATGRDGKIAVLMGIAAGQSLREQRPVAFKLPD
jgi:myo-inositol 2-dehydrogenase / D-chiro-inositol 1-dehydrogenase